MDINKIEKHLESDGQGADAVIKKENPLIGKNRFLNWSSLSKKAYLFCDIKKLGCLQVTSQ